MKKTLLSLLAAGALAFSSGCEESSSTRTEEDPDQSGQANYSDGSSGSSDDSRGGTGINLISPIGSTGLDTTFRWAVANPDSGMAYHAVVYTDKGPNPLDGRGEDIFDGGTATAPEGASSLSMSKSVTLDRGRYLNYSFSWAVRVTDSKGRDYESSSAYVHVSNPVSTNTVTNTVAAAVNT